MAIYNPNRPRVSHTRYFIFSLILIALILVGIIFYLDFRRQALESAIEERQLQYFFPQNSTVCDDLSDLGIRDECILSAAIRTKSIDACNSLENNETKSKCLFHIGQEKRDETLCETIPEGNWSAHCLALATQETEMCLAIDDDRIQSSCYYSLAFIRNETELCRSISDPNYKVHCLQKLISRESESIIAQYEGRNESEETPTEPSDSTYVDVYIPEYPEESSQLSSSSSTEDISSSEESSS